MLKIEKILCPVDFSDFSAKACEYAYSLAKHYQAKLFLQHAIVPLTAAYPYYAFPDSVNESYWKLDADVERRLKELAGNTGRNGIQPEFVVFRGYPTESILEFAENKAVDLIVMGTHGRQGIDRMAVGSVTEKVLRKAHCPVLAVRRPMHDFVHPEEKCEPVELQKILFCTDFSVHSERALSYAISLATEYNAELTLLHVLEDMPGTTDLQKEITGIIRRLEQPIPPDARDWCTIKSVVRIGKPYQEIIQLALEAQSDLVIMGVRGRSALDLALFGSTTYRVIQLGTCPVLAIHT